MISVVRHNPDQPCGEEVEENALIDELELELELEEATFVPQPVRDISWVSKFLRVIIAFADSSW